MIICFMCHSAEYKTFSRNKSELLAAARLPRELKDGSAVLSLIV